MLLENVNLVFILLPFFLAGIFYPRIVKHKTGDPLRDQLKNIQVMLVMMGVIMGVMLFMLPYTSSLSTFGYPDTVQDIDSQEKVLRLLQDYNKAIVRTTEVVYWMLFMFIFWLLTNVFRLLKLLRDRVDKEIYTDKDETI